MRYLELLEDEAADQIDPTPAEKPVAPPASTKVYFHVTTSRRLKSIQKDGLQPNHNRRWKTGFGNPLGERGNIYLISDFSAAVRWAAKQEWEHFNGKLPERSPYVIICVRENPKTLEPDPHPENSVYGNSWFQKKGSIAPEDIMKVIPLTKDLIKQVIDGGKAIMEDSMRGIVSNYSLRKCLKALAEKGWIETQTEGVYKNPDYPEYSVDLDINNPNGGPFTIFKGDRKLKTTSELPYAQQMGLKDKMTDRPVPEPEPNEWDY